MTKTFCKHLTILKRIISTLDNNARETPVLTRLNADMKRYSDSLNKVRP